MTEEAKKIKIQTELAQKEIDKLNNAQTEDVRKIIDEAFELLVSDSSPANILPEKIFVDRFLPYFAGEITDKAERDAMLDEWLNVSGGTFNEVVILSDDNKFLFRVPGIVDTNVISIVSSDAKITYSAIVKESENLKKSLPIIGENYLASQFADKINDIKENLNSADTNANIERWSNIFQKYGKKPISIKAAKTVEDTVELKEVNDDDD